MASLLFSVLLILVSLSFVAVVADQGNCSVNDICCTDGKWASSSIICRSANNQPCKVNIYCPGAGVCPGVTEQTGLKPAGTPCGGPPAGPPTCELQKTCDGTSAKCPDKFKPIETGCNTCPPNGPAQKCSGHSGTCPPCRPGCITDADCPSNTPHCHVTAGVCGDPHVRGFDGVRFNFQGESGKVFAFISNPVTVVNALLVSNTPLVTVMRAVSIRACKDVISMYHNQTVIVNEKQLDVLQRFSSNNLQVQWIVSNDSLVRFLQITVPEWWVFTIELHDSRVDIAEVAPLWKAKSAKMKTHGVLGHTLQGPSSQNRLCNSKQEGGCEVPGAWTDYEIADGLLSTQWTHSFFSQQHCHV